MKKEKKEKEKNVSKNKLENVVCKECEKEIKKDNKFCPYCGTHLKDHFFVFFITFLFIYLLVEIVSLLIPQIVISSVTSFKYGYEFLYEAVLVLVIIVVMLISKNSYVFTQRKQKLVKSILCGWPILFLAVIYFFGSITSTESWNILNLFNLALYCVTIGMYEEFLCRGWIQNEFIERYGRNKKQVIRSIIFASFIFGAMHFINILAGQSVFETFMQVIFATACGVFLGSVYYRTKNIWSVIILHAFYDFAILLGEHASIRDCTTGAVTNGILADNIVSIIFLSTFFIVGAIWALKGCDFTPQTAINIGDDSKEKKSHKGNIGLIIVTVISVGLLFLPLRFGSEEEYEKYNICFNYETKEVNEHSISTYYLNSFELNHTKETIDYINKTDETGAIIDTQEIIKKEDINLKFYIDDESYESILENVNTKEKIVLDNTIENITRGVVIENSDHYIIGVTATDVLGTKIHYTKVMKNKMSNDKEYLKKIVDSFKEYDLPTIEELGSIKLKDNNNSLLYMNSSVDDEFYIDENGNLFFIKYNNVIE